MNHEVQHQQQLIFVCRKLHKVTLSDEVQYHPAYLRFDVGWILTERPDYSTLAFDSSKDFKIFLFFIIFYIFGEGPGKVKVGGYRARVTTRSFSQKNKIFLGLI